jgi:hypothetical protein
MPLKEERIVLLTEAEGFINSQKGGTVTMKKSLLFFILGAVFCIVTVAYGIPPPAQEVKAPEAVISAPEKMVEETSQEPCGIIIVQVVLTMAERASDPTMAKKGECEGQLRTGLWMEAEYPLKFTTSAAVSTGSSIENTLRTGTIKLEGRIYTITQMRTGTYPLKFPLTALIATDDSNIEKTMRGDAMAPIKM